MARGNKYQSQEILNSVYDEVNEVLKVNVSLSADVEIGSVELKDNDSDDRGIIAFGNSAAVGSLALYVADANVKSDTAKIVTAAEIMDDWDETNRAAVNIIPSQSGVAAFTGNASVNTIRTVTAADDAGLTSLAVIAGWDNSASTGSKNSGDINHGDADTGEPLKIGGKGVSSRPTAVDANDRVNAYFDIYGRLHTYDEGSTGGASGQTLYVFTPTNSTGHGTTAYASVTTFTVTGASFTPEPEMIIGIERYSSAHVYQETITPKTHTITISGTTVTVDAMSAMAGDLFYVTCLGPERTTTLATDSQRVSEIAPLSQQFSTISLIDTTNVSAATNYYPSSTGMSMDGYEHMTLTGKLIDADGTITMTVEATNDEDTTNADWIQVYGYDSENAADDNSMAVTNDTLTFAWDFDHFHYKHFRARVINDGATNTFIIKAKQLY